MTLKLVYRMSTGLKCRWAGCDTICPVIRRAEPCASSSHYELVYKKPQGDTAPTQPTGWNAGWGGVVDHVDIRT
jgi:hypothetical protein